MSAWKERALEVAKWILPILAAAVGAQANIKSMQVERDANRATATMASPLATEDRFRMMEAEIEMLKRELALEREERRSH